MNRKKYLISFLFFFGVVIGFLLLPKPTYAACAPGQTDCTNWQPGGCFPSGVNCACFPSYGYTYPKHCADINWCVPAGTNCNNRVDNCGGYQHYFCPGGSVAMCLNNMPTCCTTGYTCAYCGGSIYSCPSGYTVDCSLGCVPVATPTPTPITKTVNIGVVFNNYTLSGTIFSDTNGNGKKDSGESNYTGPVSISLNNGTTSYNVTNSGGSYSASNLPHGQYTVTFGGLSAGNVFTYPPSPHSLIATIGPNCPTSPPPATSEASCSSGNVINLNAGVTQIKDPWIQSIGSDLRWDRGTFNNPIPSSSTYTSIPFESGRMPGILFSGSSTPNFGPNFKTGQKISDKDWKVGGSSPMAREVFTDTHSIIPTSYNFLLETAKGSGINPIVINSVTSSLAHGIYQVNGDLIIDNPIQFSTNNVDTNNVSCNGTTIPCNYVILVNGNIHINAKIQVPIGSTAIFSAKGNISVANHVGEDSVSDICDITTHAGCSIEGLYSADKNFIVEGINNCGNNISDKKLNIAGSVIANAGRQNNTFDNRRSLCARNTRYPSVSFTERPDFILNYPSMVKQTQRTWQEMAP